MNQSGQFPLGFEGATGRALTCPACRKPLPRPDVGQLVLLCDYCRTETALSPPLKLAENLNILDDEAVSDVLAAFPVTSQNESNAPVQASAPEAVEDEYEIRLEPEAERTVPAPSLAQWHTQSALPERSAAEHASRPSSSTTYESVGESTNRSDKARTSYNQSAGIYPRERHYPTLEAMQRLYKLFGYVAILIVFPYIGSRFLYLLFTTKQDYLLAFAEFSEFAVPVLFGCVALAASLFAASEGIRLAMDIQENTLRIANNAGRRKLEATDTPLSLEKIYNRS